LFIDKGIKDLYEMKLLQLQSQELLDCMCKEVSSLNDEQMMEDIVDVAIFCSIKKGNFDFIFGMVQANPDLMWSHGVNSGGARNLSH